MQIAAGKKFDFYTSLKPCTSYNLFLFGILNETIYTS